MLKSLLPRGLFRPHFQLCTTKQVAPFITKHRLCRALSTSMDDKINLDDAKKLAAHAVVDEWINENVKVVGIGSGSTIVFAVERLAERVWKDGTIPSDIICVPSSYQARQLIVSHNLRLSDLENHPKIDVYIDGADEVDNHMVCIKGGGACLLQEKIVASCSDKMIVIADYTKKSLRLGEQWCKGVPIEVIPMAYMPIKLKIEELFGGKALLRMATAKAGPIVTDNGNFILDWHFAAHREYDWDKINHAITMIPGVLETGLFVNMAFKAYYGMPDGKVKIQHK